MKANELRIGNFITINGITHQITPRYFSSLAGGKTFNEQKEDGYSELSGYFKPIPITTEILDKAGFWKMPQSKWYGNDYDYKTNDVYTIQNDYVIKISTGYFVFRFQEFTAAGQTDSDILYGIEMDWYPKVQLCNIDKELLTYLHQLQNLYFALTGEELEINL